MYPLIIMEIVTVIVLLLVGIIFFLIELFLIPGVSLAGIAGTAFLGSAIFYAYAKISSTVGHITLIGGIVLLGIAVWIFLRSRTLEKMSLKAEVDGKIDPLKDVNLKVGDSGKTISRLAPMGKIKVNGVIIEAKTNDDFIDQNQEVIVTQIFNTNVLVEKR